MKAMNLTQNLTNKPTKKPAPRPSLSRRGFLGGLASGAAALALGACSGGSRRSSSSGTVEYWLWDASQLPAYEACAAAFEEATGIHVNITQIAWDDYWTKLTAGFIAGTGPGRLHRPHLQVRPVRGPGRPASSG